MILEIHFKILLSISLSLAADSSDELHIQERHRLDASCGFSRLDVSLLSSCIKPISFIKFYQVCENQTRCNLIFQDFLQALKQLASSLWIKSLDNQLTSSLLTTCSRLVIVKLEQAMGTHSHIGLMTAS